MSAPSDGARRVREFIAGGGTGSISQIAERLGLSSDVVAGAVRHMKTSGADIAEIGTGMFRVAGHMRRRPIYGKAPPAAPAAPKTLVAAAVAQRSLIEQAWHGRWSAP